MPEYRIPEVGARIMDLQEPQWKMLSTTGWTQAGTVLVLDEPDVTARSSAALLLTPVARFFIGARRSLASLTDRNPRCGSKSVSS